MNIHQIYGFVVTAGVGWTHGESDAQTQATRRSFIKFRKMNFCSLLVNPICESQTCIHPPRKAATRGMKKVENAFEM